MGNYEANPVLDLSTFESEVNKFETLSDIEKLAETCKIDILKELPPPPIAIKIAHNGQQITLFTKGNFSIVTGKPKGKKSFFISMLMATAIKGSFQNHLYCPDNGMNILFDTEQAEHKVLQVSKRICKLAEIDNPTSFTSYCLRPLDPGERLDLIEHVLSITENLNFVAIDGIIDLAIDPILQAEQAQNVISKLMKWTAIYKIHIVCVLHYNKTISTLLGHLGSFAHRKADCVIEVVKDTDNENISFVNPVDCREREFLPFAFSVDEFGMPKIETELNPIKSKSKTEKPQRLKAINPNDLDLTIHTEILQQSFTIFTEQIYSVLWKTIKQVVIVICKDKIKDTIGDNKAKDFIAYYLLNEMIVKIEVKKKIYYTLKEQKVLQFNDVGLTV